MSFSDARLNSDNACRLIIINFGAIIKVKLTIQYYFFEERGKVVVNAQY